MCRIFVRISTKPLNSGEFEQIWSHFVLMAQDKTTIHEYNKDDPGTFIHGHGFGIGWLEEGMVKTYKSEKPIWQCEIPSSILEHILQSRYIIIHARRASPSLPVNIDMCHPFVKESNHLGQVALVHNGTIKDKSELKISSGLEPSTVSDTERLLLHIISTISERERIEQQLYQLMMNIPEKSSANIVVKIKDIVYAMTNYVNTPKYLTMKYHANDTEVIIASEEFPIKKKWNDLENHKLISVNIKSPNTFSLFPKNRDH